MLSCYTTSLIGHLRREDLDVEATFAAKVDLSVRIDAPGGALAFTQHGRVDPGLGYRATTDWEAARAALLAEFERRGDVIAVADSRNLPWSPSWQRENVPHWLRLAGRRDGRWLVLDDFDALLPHGQQRPHREWTDDAELRALLAPLPELPHPLHQRDVHALGEPVEVPPPGTYRWLEHGADRPRPPEGRWVRGTPAALAYLKKRLAHDMEALRWYIDDLWAAGRHHQYRAPHDEHAVAAWGELARSLRFAVQSADRGRPRLSLIARAFDRVLAATAPTGAVR